MMRRFLILILLAGCASTPRPPIKARPPKQARQIRTADDGLMDHWPGWLRAASWATWGH